MEDEYIKRYKDELIFSKRQLEQISSHHLMDLYMENNELKDLPNINPDWIENWNYKDFSIWYLEDLLKNGVYDISRTKVRKTKKGFVLEMKFKWTSKGYKQTQYLCRCCKKSGLLNFDLICKRCTKELKKKRKFRNFWETNPVILKEKNK